MRCLEGCRTVRRFAVQVGGVGVALAGVAALGVAAFGCGSAAPPAVRASASASARATATADPRVAEVEAAVRRYVQAMQDSARTGDATAVDALVVPGSQAAGNAGVGAAFSRDNHYAFIASRVDIASLTVSLNVTTAMASVSYSLYGHTADWPSLKPRESD